MKSNSICRVCGSIAFELFSSQECDNPKCRNYSREFVEGLWNYIGKNISEYVVSFGENPCREILIESIGTGCLCELGAEHIIVGDSVVEPQQGDLVGFKNSNSAIGYVLGIEANSSGEICARIDYSPDYSVYMSEILIPLAHLETMNEFIEDLDELE